MFRKQALENYSLGKLQQSFKKYIYLLLYWRVEGEMRQILDMLSKAVEAIC